MNQEIVLGIDFGLKRIGLAILRKTDLSEPLKVVPNRAKWEDAEVVREFALNSILELIESEKVERIVVGVSENVMAQKIMAFVEKLQTVTSVPIETVDETLSSQVVHRRLLESGMKLQKRQGPIDHYAAAVILEEWLGV